MGKYDQEQMKKAILAIQRGSSFRSAAKEFNVDRSTLKRKVEGKLEVGAKPGPKTTFSKQTEDVLAQWILAMGKSGFPVTKDLVLFSANKLAKELSVNFVKGNPGKKWYKLFLERHPNITSRIPQSLTPARTSLTEAAVLAWFEEVWTYFEENNLVPVLADPRRVFNSDESAFYLNPTGSKVLVQKGSKNVYHANAIVEKENVTVLVTVNAAGELEPPMVVYRYVRRPPTICESVPSWWGIGLSESGWMTHETFYEYMTNVFHPWLLEENIPKPVVFFLDGHTSHISQPVSEFCKSNGIELVALLPNATHLLQPLDVPVFHSLKSQYRKTVSKWRMENDGRTMKKPDFAPILDSVLCNLKSEVVQNGFRKCGLVPWNPEAIKLPFKEISGVEVPKEVFPLNLLEKEIGNSKMEMFFRKENDETWSGPTEDH